MIFFLNFFNNLLNTSTMVLSIRIQLDSELLLLQSKIAQEKKDFYKEPGKVREIYLSWLRALTTEAMGQCWKTWEALRGLMSLKERFCLLGCKGREGDEVRMLIWEGLNVQKEHGADRWMWEDCGEICQQGWGRVPGLESWVCRFQSSCLTCSVLF